MKNFKWFVEDAPVNATGTNVVGTGDDDSTVVVKKKVKIFKRKRKMTEKEIEEARNYRKEYDNYHSQPEQRERNAARLRARRKLESLGKVKKFDKKDVHHKDNNPLNNEEDNLAVTTQNWNRSEPRLREDILDEESAPKQMSPEQKLKIFKKLKSGQEIKLWFDSSIRKGSDWVTFVVGRRTVVGVNKVEKVTLKTVEKGRMKYFLYNRNGQVTFAMGDMGASLVSIQEELIAEAKHDLYHKTYSAAVQHAADQAKKRGYEVDQDSWDSQITHGDRKPSTGKTVSKKIALTKGGKPQRKHLNIQVHAMSSGKYELNMYIEELEESINIQERELSDKEQKRREVIAKDLSDADFKKRYGDRWKEVKMGTATNMAKDESIVEADAATQEKGKADRQKAKELKIAKAIAIANAKIAKEQEKVQAMTIVQTKIKDAASKSEETIMSKKYLNTKPGTLEESILGMWQDAITEVGELNLKQEGFPSSLVKKAVKLAADMGGDMTNAVKAIEKMKKGLSKDKAVVDALRSANEQVEGNEKVDGRTKSYREAVRRIKLRQERLRLRAQARITEASGDAEAYKKFFDAALKKFDAKSPADMDDEKKKKFFDYIDKNWEGKGEKAEDVEKKNSIDEKKELHYVEYQFKNKREAIAAKKFFDSQQRMGFIIIDDNISNGELSVEVDSSQKKGDFDMTPYHNAIVKKLKPKILKQENVNEALDELYSVEYKFKSDKDAKAAATFVAKHASPGKLAIDVNGKVVDVRVVGGASGSGEKELDRAKAEVDKYFKKKIVDTQTENEETIHEAAIDDLRKIVKTKSMGKVSGSKVDLFSASAMVQVYDALNDKNRKKVDKMLSNKGGVLTFADFAMSQMK